MQIDIMPLQPEDVPAIIAMTAAAMPMEGVSEAKFCRHILLDPNFRDGGALIAKVGNCVAGFIYAAYRAQPLNEADSRRAYITTIAVKPRFRRQSVGGKLLAAAEQFVREAGRSEIMIAPYAPAYFIPGVDLAAYPNAVAMFQRAGYTEVNRPIAMQTNLWPITEPQFVIDARNRLSHEGVHIEAFKPALTQPILQFARNEFGPDWEAVYRDAMQQICRGDCSPTRIAVAHQNCNVLGISHHDGERFGPIGVAAAARGRCIGQVLMYETLSAQRLSGLRTAWFLWSDDRTADKLYRGAGFEEFRRYVILSKSLE